MSQRRAMNQAPVLAALALLLGQFAIGMAVNLCVAVSRNHLGAHPVNYVTGLVHSVGWAIGSGPPVLAAHAALGLLRADAERQHCHYGWRRTEPLKPLVQVAIRGRHRWQERWSETRGQPAEDGRGKRPQ